MSNEQQKSNPAFAMLGLVIALFMHITKYVDDALEGMLSFIFQTRVDVPNELSVVISILLVIIVLAVLIAFGVFIFTLIKNFLSSTLSKYENSETYIGSTQQKEKFYSFTDSTTNTPKKNFYSFD